MPRIAGELRQILAVLACVAGAGTAHLALSVGASGPVWIAVLVLPVVALAGWLVAYARNRVALWVVWFLILLASIVMIYALERREGLGFAAAYGLPHAAAYLFLLWYFGRTLRSGREPLITRLARQMRGALPPELERYTRRLTIAWCAFFAAQLAGSAALLTFAPLDAWSFFVNVMNVPLVATMFLGDYLYRIARYRDHHPTSIARVWRAFIEDAGVSISAKSR